MSSDFDESLTVEYNGIDIRDMDMYHTRKHHISYASEGSFPFGSAYDYLFDYPVDTAKDVDCIRELLAKIDAYGLQGVYKSQTFDILDYLHQDNAMLSSGQRQKITVLRAILKDSSVLVFDEPTSFMDHLSRKQIISYLERTRYDRITIVATHDPDLLLIADVVISL